MPELDLHPSNHDLWKLLRNRVDAGIPMTQIAGELGCEVDDLCAWIMRYREPKTKAYQSKKGPPITYVEAAIQDHWSLARSAQRRENWLRAKEGARVARQAS